MKIGDKVKFVGDTESYRRAFLPVLKRKGEVMKLCENGKAFVSWIPKTKKGQKKGHYHKITDLEIIDT